MTPRPNYSSSRLIASLSSPTETDPWNFALIRPSRPTRNVHGSPGRCHSRDVELRDAGNALASPERPRDELVLAGLRDTNMRHVDRGRVGAARLSRHTDRSSVARAAVNGRAASERATHTHAGRSRGQ